MVGGHGEQAHFVEPLIKDHRQATSREVLVQRVAVRVGWRDRHKAHDLIRAFGHEIDVEVVELVDEKPGRILSVLPEFLRVDLMTDGVYARAVAFVCKRHGNPQRSGHRTSCKSGARCLLRKRSAERLSENSQNKWSEEDPIQES